jgi:GTP-binding protein
LLFVVSSESENVKEDYFKLLNEVVSYDKNLLEKERFLVVTKNDLLDEKKIEKIEKSIKGIIEYLFISSIAMSNLEEMKDMLWKKILKSKNF